MPDDPPRRHRESPQHRRDLALQRTARLRGHARWDQGETVLRGSMSQKEKYRLPEFLGVGPPRTGTTWLHNVLEGHVDLPYGIKETGFFSVYYDKGIDWYARHFRYATGERPVGEISCYFFEAEARK